ncbi:hypothetical protein BC351_21975 [Paenibacillus ferrarius]|uniref:Uncharacterized protein n=1 Tax=Paenibacillus ferrarius TaxID=1469647 RepID=A0A1V4HP32_9BACL|nr:hypothetical protein BC351_21975 [Paenibacillus ferrarius]
MHPLESFFRIQEGKAHKACIIAGFVMISHDSSQKACTYAGFSLRAVAGWHLAEAGRLLQRVLC